MSVNNIKENMADFWGRGLSVLGGGLVLIGLIGYLANPYLMQFARDHLIDGVLLSHGSLRKISSLPMEIGQIGVIIILLAIFRRLFLKYENSITKYYAEYAENKRIKWLADNWNYILMGTFFLMVFAMYHEGMSYFFIRDDFYLLDLARKWTSWKELLVPFKSNTPTYRPMVGVYYFFMYRVFGLNSTGYHVINALFHAINGFLLYYLVKNISNNKLIGFLTGFVFIIRYSLFYNVLLACIWEAQMAFFFLLAFLFYLKSDDKKIFLAWSVICWMIALFSKEMVVVTPVLFFLYEWSIRYSFSLKVKSISAIFKKQALYWLVLMIYLGIRMSSRTGWLTSKDSMYYMAFDKTAINNFINYIRFSFDGPFDPVTCLVIIFVVFSVFCFKRGYSLFRKNSSVPYKQLIIYGIIWFIFALGPVVFVRLTSAYWMYLALMGFSITVASIFNYFVSKANQYNPASGRLLVIAFCLLGFVNASYKIHNKIFTKDSFLYTAVIGENYLRDMKNAYPELPKASTIYFTPRNNEVGIDHIKNITYGLLFQIYYDDSGLNTYYLKPEEVNQLKITNDKTYLFTFDRDHLYDQTSSLYN